MRLRVVERLRNLLPEVTFEPDGDVEIVALPGLVGSIRFEALADACHREDRSSWGAIGGEFCNLVVSRIRAHQAGPVTDAKALDALFPVLVPDEAVADAMIREATPTADLAVASQPWLPGLRVELHYGGAGSGGRLLVRDVEALRRPLMLLVPQAIGNLVRLTSILPSGPLGERGGAARVLAIRLADSAPAMLLADSAHLRMFDELEARSGTRPHKVLAMAPTHDLLLYADVQDKAATSFMVGEAWRRNVAVEPRTYPLSARIFSVDGPGKVRYLDVGLGSAQCPGWTTNRIGPVTFLAPEDWRVGGADGGFQLAPESGSPRLVVRPEGVDGATPATAHERAVALHRSSASGLEVGHGFFNDLAWAWVDTGVRSGAATACMFVAVEGGVVSIETEAPETMPPRDRVLLQKVIATVRAA